MDGHNPTGNLEKEYQIYKFNSSFGERYNAPVRPLIRNIFIIGSIVLVLLLAGFEQYQSAAIAFVSVGLLYIVFSSLSKTHTIKIKNSE
tara:strand:- start:393 stop:659 length:267 start_codon:yes stop_codon:yes gene_type:complete